MDTMELEAACQTIRSDKECKATERLQTTYRKKFDFHLLGQSRKNVAGLLGEAAKTVPIGETLRQSVERTEKQRHANRTDQER